MKGKISIGNLDENLAALICYLPVCFNIVFCVVLLKSEKFNNFIRFHAIQSLYLTGLFLIINVVCWIIHLILASISELLASTFGFLFSFIGFIYMVLSIYTMLKAYAYEEWEIPLIGSYAHKTV
ncbi:MAG: DUF4870 domain-containing protein [Candidatus Coatesbacteria bacterium]|nr:DUF4870 domain-containing protein [Candidatus Coatesbacteria bacterium]